MKIIVYQQIIPKDNEREFKQIHKIFESNIIPHKGDKIADSFFKDPYEYEVADCTIDYQDDKCYIDLFPMKVSSVDQVSQQVDISKLHKWKAGAELI